jgi:hypothetical protein
MGDKNTNEPDIVSIASLSYLLPYGLTYDQIVSFYRNKARRINNLYLSNNKDLITSYFIEEMYKSEISYYDLDDAKELLFTYDIEQLKYKLALCANLVYRFYLLKFTGHSTTELYSTEKILELIYK